MPRRIAEADCIGCGACEGVCPVSCISEGSDGKRVIDESVCVDCGTCQSVCPVSCISEV